MFKLIANWRRERETIRELSRLSDRELADLGISRADIHAVAAGAAPAERNETATLANDRAAAMAPSWGAHVQQSIAA